MKIATSTAPSSLRSNPAARIAFIGLHLQQNTEYLHKLKMETAGKPLSRRDANHIDTIEQSIARQKQWLELVRVQAAA
jgi:hypothetical protein